MWLSIWSIRCEHWTEICSHFPKMFCDLRIEAKDCIINKVLNRTGFTLTSSAFEGGLFQGRRLYEKHRVTVLVVEQSSQKWNLKKHWLLTLSQPKTSWLFPQIKTDIKNFSYCLEQCNWILIYILLHFMVYPLFKEQNLPSFPKTILRTKVSPVIGK